MILAAPRSARRWLLAAVIGWTWPTVGSARAQSASANPADLAVVIYNESDPLSHELADFYAEKRGIPAERVVGLRCSLEEEISREEYDTQIAGPLRQIFDVRGWW